MKEFPRCKKCGAPLAPGIERSEGLCVGCLSRLGETTGAKKQAKTTKRKKKAAPAP